MCRIVGGARAVDGQEEYLEGQILADMFGFESGVTTEESCSLALYYAHVNGITRNTQLLYVLLCSYRLSRSDISEMFPQHDSHSISLELCTKGL